MVPRAPSVVCRGLHPRPLDTSLVLLIVRHVGRKLFPLGSQSHAVALWRWLLGYQSHFVSRRGRRCIVCAVGCMMRVLEWLVDVVGHADCRSRGSHRRGSRGAALFAHAVGSMARGVDGSRRVDVAGVASSIFRQVMADPRMRRASSCRSRLGRRSPGSLGGLGGRHVLSWRSWFDAGGMARCMNHAPIFSWSAESTATHPPLVVSARRGLC